MSDATRTIIVNWIGVVVSSGLLGASIMMLFKGTLPAPLPKVKVPAIVSTGIFVVGMTALLVFGTPDLLQSTFGLFAK